MRVPPIGTRVRRHRDSARSLDPFAARGRRPRVRGGWRPEAAFGGVGSAERYWRRERAALDCVARVRERKGKQQYSRSNLVVRSNHCRIDARKPFTHRLLPASSLGECERGDKLFGQLQPHHVLDAFEGKRGGEAWAMGSLDSLGRSDPLRPSPTRLLRPTPPPAPANPRLAPCTAHLRVGGKRGS